MGTLSPIKSCPTPVPQGTVLLPVLFNTHTQNETMSLGLSSPMQWAEWGSGNCWESSIKSKVEPSCWEHCKEGKHETNVYMERSSLLKSALRVMKLRLGLYWNTLHQYGVAFLTLVCCWWNRSIKNQCIYLNVIFVGKRQILIAQTTSHILGH